MTDNSTHAPSIGQTGGLPGANADPRTAELSDAEIAESVGMADVSPAREAATEDAGPVPGPGPDADEVGADPEEGSA